MTSSMGRRAGMVVGSVALAATFGGWSTPAGAATGNPCKVLRKSEIQHAFGGTVGNPKKGLSTPVSAECEFSVSADGDRPAGTVTVHVMTTGAKAAYTGLAKTSQYVPIDGLPSALWAEKVHVVDLLKGDVLLGVQGGFVITDPLPIHFFDDETQLTDLAKIGVKRL